MCLFLMHGEYWLTIVCAVWWRYKRFKKGHHNEDTGTNIQSSNGTSKYVILDDDTEAQDDTGWPECGR